MLTLISIWTLEDGCPAPLRAVLTGLADEVVEHEPDTLMYLVHLPEPNPLGPDHEPLVPPPSPIPDSRQDEVVFVEIYRDARAFARHVTGPTFTRFRNENMKYFVEDPDNPGWPKTRTPFLERLSGFIRTSAG